MATSVRVNGTDTMSIEISHPPFNPRRSPNHHGNKCSTEAPSRRKVAYTSNSQYTSWKRSQSSTLRESSMPVSTGSQSLLASLPSFMSVFGDGTDTQKAKEAITTTTQSPARTINTAKRPNNASSFSSQITRRDSASTFESVESSPTTTISTIESSLTEPSPSSSPDSPTSMLPLSPFKSLRTNSTPAAHSIMDNKNDFSNSFPSLPGLDRVESPNKKMRNMKNLSVNTLASNRPGAPLPKVAPSNASSGLNGHAFSAPPTPAFIVPPKAPRRKPSNLGLTISTPDPSSSTPPSRDGPNVVPQTPSNPQLRTIRFLQTSSSGPLFSPTIAPEGGMRLPPFSNMSSAARLAKPARPPLSVSPHSSFDTTSSSPVTKQTLDHVQEETNYDLPLSQEVKSPAYPQGPVCIYDPHVFLYLEPSHVEAREFDVVLNVAREVKNPFSNPSEEAAVSQIADAALPMDLSNEMFPLAGRDSMSEPQTAISERSFSSAFQTLSENAARTVPSTPKASRPEPEYIHVPWDHNTNVVNDLLRLCELIEDRVRQDKRVLVHCQCGVSRSASLVVAYGLYKNRQLTVQEAYDAVKNRSRWIGPNMNLIYQLSEFKSKLEKSSTTGTHAWHSWKAQGSVRSNVKSTVTSDLRLGLPSTSLRSTPQKSLSAPSHIEHQPASARADSFCPPGSAQLAANPPAGDITPGPSSAPPDMQWLPDRPSNSKDDAKVIIEEPPTMTNPPDLMDTDSSLTLFPLQEAIQEKGTAPAGAVANDIQKVAKDLEEKSTEKSSALIHPPNLTDIDTPVEPQLGAMDESDNVVSSPPRSMDIDTDSQSAPPPKFTAAEEARADSNAPSPGLPAGFSSLFTRRQGLQRLPLRQEALRFTTTPMAQPFPHPSMHDDVPPTPSLLSPRAAEFTASPFHRTVAGDLAGSSVFEQGLMSPKAVAEDPRSPHQVGEAPITRSIFDMI